MSGRKGAVHLQQEPGADDRLVLVAERFGDGVEKRLIALVVLVPADARRGGRGYEDVLIRDGRRLSSESCSYSFSSGISILPS